MGCDAERCNRMIDNPFSSPYLVGTMWRLAVVLLSLLGWALLRRHRNRVGRQNAIQVTKVLTAMWMAPILVIALFGGGVALAAVIAVIALQALREYAQLVNLRPAYSVALLAYSFVGLVVVIVGPRYLLLALPLGLFLVATLIPIISGIFDDSHRQVGAAVFGYLYIGAPLTCIMLIRDAEPWGLQLLIISGTAAALADAGGSFVGSWLGGPRLAPRISPGKTWAGAAGSLLGATAGVLSQWFVAPVTWTLGTVVLLSLSVAVGAIWGDLIESFVKRDFGAKDTGKILAGFGGVLDRFDSIFLAVPVSYVAFLATQ